MRIACAHHGAAILEDLHMIDLGHRSQFLELGGPGADHVFDVFGLHGGKGEVVAGREADHPAEPGFAFRHQQSPVFNVQRRREAPGLSAAKSLSKTNVPVYGRIHDPADPGVSRAEVAGRVIFRLPVNRDLLELTLPGPTGAMGDTSTHSLVSGFSLRCGSSVRFNASASSWTRPLGYNVRESLEGTINATKNGNLTESVPRPIVASGVIAYMVIISHP